MRKEELLRKLKKEKILKTPILLSAFSRIDRAEFVPDELKAYAYIDEPLPIGSGQTISQPSTVAFMLELLQPKPGQKILDVGFGSGWTTALLAHSVGNTGHVHAIELKKDIFEFGAENIRRQRLKNVRLSLGKGQAGLPGEAPFDGVLISAAAKEAPKELLAQLSPGGRMVLPMETAAGQSVVAYQKNDSGKLSREDYPGFIFVPIVID